MKLFSCLKRCAMFWKRQSEMEERLEEAREVRRKAELNLRQARASLNGENDWFLCVRKISENGKTIFSSCVPKEENGNG